MVDGLKLIGQLSEALNRDCGFKTATSHERTKSLMATTVAAMSGVPFKQQDAQTTCNGIVLAFPLI